MSLVPEGDIKRHKDKDNIKEDLPGIHQLTYKENHKDKERKGRMTIILDSWYNYILFTVRSHHQAVNK